MATQLANRPSFDAILMHCAAKDRAWRAFNGAMRANVARIDPRTQGNQTLALNWGNEAAGQYVRRAWARWHGYSEAWQRQYTALCRADVRAAGGNPSF